MEEDPEEDQMAATQMIKNTWLLKQTTEHTFQRSVSYQHVPKTVDYSGSDLRLLIAFLNVFSSNNSFLLTIIEEIYKLECMCWFKHKNHDLHLVDLYSSAFIFPGVQLFHYWIFLLHLLFRQPSAFEIFFLKHFLYMTVMMLCKIHISIPQFCFQTLTADKIFKWNNLECDIRIDPIPKYPVSVLLLYI